MEWVGNMNSLFSGWLFGGESVLPSLEPGQIIVGDAEGKASAVTMSGFLEIDDMGVTTVNPLSSITLDNLTLTGEFIGAINPVSTVDGSPVASQEFVVLYSEGRQLKQPCVLAIDSNVDISTGLTAGTEIQGYTLVLNDRILLFGQTDETQNGGYVVPDAGAASRASDMSTGTEILQSYLWITNGTYQGSQFLNTNTSIDLGVTNIVFDDVTKTIPHNSTLSIQGGTTNEYFHLTSAEHTNLTSGDPVFDSITLNDLSANQIVLTNGSKVLATAASLSVVLGGTGQTSYTNGQLLIGNTTGNTLAKATLTGTANQVIVTNGAGSITLSLPQNISTTTSPTFAGLNITGKTGGVIPYFSSNVLTTNSNFIFSNGVFRVGANLGVTNGANFGDGSADVELGIGQGSSNYLQFIWQYDGTPANAYAEIKCKLGNNDIVVQKDGGSFIVGDPGTESSGIDILGTIVNSPFKISNINGSNLAQAILHRHSTTINPIIIAARSNSDDSSHADVTNGMSLFGIYGSGYAGTNYKFFGNIIFAADDTGTISDASAPGKMLFQITPNGSTIPVTWLTVNNDKTATFAGTISGALSGNASTATALQNTRSIYGNNFNGTADVTGAITVTGINIASLDSGKIPYFSSGVLTTNANFTFSSGVFRVGASLGVTNGASFGDATTDVVLGIGQGSSNYLKLAWDYNATASSAYALIETQLGNNDLILQLTGGDVGIGTTTTTEKLTINGGVSATKGVFDNVTIDGNTVSATDSGGNLLLDTSGGSVVLVDNAVCGAAGTALTSGFTTSRSSNPRIWLYETGASTDNKIWEHLADSGTYRFRVTTDDLTNSVSVYNVTRSGVGSLVFAIPIATVTISSQLNVDNLRLDGNTLSSTNSNGNIVLDPSGTGQIQLGTSSSDYLQMRVGGGNQYGYLFGSFAGTGDGIELGYNFYYDSSGAGQIGTAAGGTAYLQVGYGEFKFFAQEAGAGNPVQRAILQGNGNWTYSGNITLEDNKYLYLGTGQDSRIGFDGTDTIWNLQNAGVGRLFWQINDAQNNGGVELVQYGAGDSAMTFTLAGTQSYILGIDNSDSDKFKICTTATMGSGGAIEIDTSGNITSIRNGTGVTNTLTVQGGNGNSDSNISKLLFNITNGAGSSSSNNYIQTLYTSSRFDMQIRSAGLVDFYTNGSRAGYFDTSQNLVGLGGIYSSGDNKGFYTGANNNLHIYGSGGNSILDARNFANTGILVIPQGSGNNSVLQITESTATGSARAGLAIGDWVLVQDLAIADAQTFSIYKNSIGEVVNFDTSGNAAFLKELKINPGSGDAILRWQEAGSERYMQSYSVTGDYLYLRDTQNSRDLQRWNDNGIVEILSHLDIESTDAGYITTIANNSSTGFGLIIDCANSSAGNNPILAARGNAGATTTFVAFCDGTITMPNLGSGTGTTLILDGSNLVRTLTSSLRYKENIEDIKFNPNKLLNLSAKSFNYKTDATKNKSVGWIAEEMAEQIPELVVYKNGEPDSINYTTAIAVLNEIVKEQQTKINKLESILNLN